MPDKVNPKEGPQVQGRRVKCTCGKCNVCKTRERMRRIRAAGKTIKEMNRGVDLMATPIKKRIKIIGDRRAGMSFVATRQTREIEKLLTRENLEDLGFWVNGADRSNFYGLEELLDANKRPEEREIQDLEKRIQQHHIKTIKGHDYFYSKYNGEQFYHGKHDPRPELSERVLKLEEEIKIMERDFRACVRKKIGNHLVIDLVAFGKLKINTKEIRGGRRLEIIKISEMVV